MTEPQGETPSPHHRLFKPRLSEQLADLAKSALEKKGLIYQAKKIDRLFMRTQPGSESGHTPPHNSPAKGGTVV
ncbi:hypothetical protein EBZ35_04765 [bacterium]|nr:hypothetical protein [bacterium]